MYVVGNLCGTGGHSLSRGISKSKSKSRRRIAVVKALQELLINIVQDVSVVLQDRLLVGPVERNDTSFIRVDASEQSKV